MLPLAEQTVTQTVVRHISSSQYCSLLSELSQDLLDSEGSRSKDTSTASTIVDLLLNHRHKDAAGCTEPRKKAFDAILAFSRQLVRGEGLEDNIDGVRISVELCAKYDPLLHAMIQDCVASLLSQIHNLSSDPDAFNIKSEESLVLLLQSVPTLSCELNYDAQFTTSASLAFLKVLAWRKSIQNLALFQHIIKILLVLVGHVSLSISKQARDTTCAILANCNDENPLTALAHYSHDQLSVLLWTRIVELSQDALPSHCKGYALSIWLTAILSRCISFPLEENLQDAQYWRILHWGLGQGSYEQHKSSLAIARISMTLLDSDIDNEYTRFEVAQSEEYNACFEKFCTLYETIASRYLNQVQECLTDLELLARDTTKIHKAWLITLITAALEPRNQESIRNIVGNWSMEFLPGILRQCIAVSARFLERFFLPWAATGSLFIATIERDDHGSQICRHGEKLATCLRDLLKTIGAAEDQQEITRSVLRYLEAQAGRIFASARVFLLEGVRNGMSGERPCLESQEVDILIKVGNMGGFQDVMNDFMIYQCVEISKNAIHEIDNEGFRQLMKAARSLKEEPPTRPMAPKEAVAAAFLFLTQSQYTHNTEESALPERSVRLHEDQFKLESLVMILRDTKQQSLKGHGVRATCDCLDYILDNCPLEDLNSEQMATVISSIWEEIERQDYPKRILMRIPKLILHPSCIEKCLSMSSLTGVISTIIGKLQRLVEKRIYAFPPFARALRRSILLCKQEYPLPLVDVFVRLASYPPIAKPEFQLAAAVAAKFSQEIPRRNVEYYLGHSEGYGWACVFDTLNRWPRAEVNVARQIVDRLLIPWAEQKQPIPVFSKWKTSVQMQMALILLQRVVGNLSSTEFDSYLTKLYYILSLEPLPRYRYLLEWIILRFYVQQPDRRWQVLKSLDAPDLSNPKHVVSMMKIAASIAQLEDCTEDFMYDYLLQLNIFAASPKIVLRHEAQWQFPPLWQIASQKSWRSILDNPCLSGFNAFVLGLKTFHNPPDGRLLEKFHPVRDHSLTHLLSGPYLNLEPYEESRLRRDDILAVGRDAGIDITLEDESMIMPLGHDQLSARNNKAVSSILGQGSGTPVAQNSPSIPLQMKANTWTPSAITVDQSRNAAAHIVVASFIESAYNLGGITRACEILGVKTLYMRNPAATLKDQGFTTLSVSSELWLPIQDLAPSDVPGFLVEKKLAGFQIVGIEQTDQSKVLGSNSCVFKENTVLVLGGERKGIPATALRECDWCVEIEQKGVTRSMNVQTATACVLYEYARQLKMGTSQLLQ